MRIKNLFSVFLPIIVLILWSNWINAEVSNHKNWGFSAIGGVNFALAQCDLKKIGYKMDDGGSFWFAPPVQFNTTKDSLETAVPFSDADAYYRIGFDCLKNNPKQLLYNATHIKNIFFSTLYPDFFTHHWQLYLRQCFQWITCILFMLYCMSMFVLKKKDSTYWLLWGLMISFLFSMYWMNPGEERYMIPYFFVLTLYCIPTIKSLFLKKN